MRTGQEEQLAKLSESCTDLAGAATQRMKSQSEEQKPSQLLGMSPVTEASQGAEHSGLSPQPHHQYSTATPNDEIRTSFN